MFSVKGGVQAGRVGFSRGFHSSPTILNRLRNYREWHPNKQWEPPRNLTYEALPLDEALIKPGTHWSPPRGGYDHLPFRVRTTAEPSDYFEERFLRITTQVTCRLKQSILYGSRFSGLFTVSFPSTMTVVEMDIRELF
mmetsp:Transcript_44550/g.172744  ORF Transcript_44550/g.172744 Transcript_44550/m.172744 type:complete len:138 (-) Transcript_44550:1972-2385(-)